MAYLLQLNRQENSLKCRLRNKLIIDISKFLAHDNDFPAFWLVP